MPSEIVRLLILCKTYPSPSAAHVETSCVAAMVESGKLVRIYPMPFRLVSSEKQFKKWQWITARIEKSKKDHRPESHKIFVDTIVPPSAPLGTNNGWAERRVWIDKAILFEDFSLLEQSRKANNVTLGLLRPRMILGLDVTQVSTPEWSKAEIEKLLQLQQQSDLFDSTDAKVIKTLRKLPFDFHYRYLCEMNGNTSEHRHKIVDWEIGALFWNVRRAHGPNWEAPFRNMLEQKLPSADLMFLMGTIHRFPDQWLIVSLIYPPKRPDVQIDQGSLF